MQDDLGRATPVSGLPSRPASRNAFDENVDTVSSADADLAHLHHDLRNSDTLQSGANGSKGSSVVQSMGAPSSYTYAAALGASLSRSTTPDPQLVARAPSPCITPIGGGRVSASEKRSVISPNPNSFNGVSSGINESADLVAALSGMNLSTNGVIDNENHLSSHMRQEVDNHQSYLFGLQGGENHTQRHAYLKKSESGQMHIQSNPQSAKGSFADLGKSNGSGADMSNSSVRPVEIHKSAIPSSNSYMKGSPTSTLNGGGLHAQYQQFDGSNPSYSNYGLSGYSVNPALASMMAGQIGTGNVSPFFDSVAAGSGVPSPAMDSRVLGGGLASGQSESHNLGRIGSQMAGGGLQTPFMDPMYLQYLRTSEYAAAQLAPLNDPSADRSYLGNSYMNLLELQKAYLALLSPQKSQYVGGKSGGSNHHGYYGNPAFGVGISYPGSPMASPVISNSPVGPGSPLRHSELNLRFPSGMRSLAGGVMGAWHVDGGCNMDEGFASSLLEEFKSNKTKSFELSEIAGHVVEFRWVLLLNHFLIQQFGSILKTVSFICILQSVRINMGVVLFNKNLKQRRQRRRTWFIRRSCPKLLL